MARQAYLYSTSLVLRWMIRLNIGVLLFLFAASPVVVPIFFNIASAAGNTYYVDNCVTVGSDSNNGTSPSTPWLTINKVNVSSFSAGDSILFNKGCTWREMLTVPSSGSAGNPITFGAYGTGAAPIMDGSDVTTGWTTESSMAVFPADIMAETWDATISGGHAFTTAGSGYTDLNGWVGGLGSGSVIDGDSTAISDHTGGTSHMLEIQKVSPNYNARVRWRTSGDNAITYAQGWVYIAAEGLADTNGIDLFHAQNTAFQDDYSIVLKQATGGALQFMMSCSHCSTTAETTTISKNRWYKVEFKYDYTNSAYEWRINGVTISSGTLVSTPFTGPRDFLLGDVSGSYTATIYFDDFKVGSTGYYNPGFTAYKKVVSIQPQVVYQDTTRLTEVTTDKIYMAPGTFWWDSGNTQVYVRTTGDDAPSGHTMLVGQRTNISITGKQYVTVTGMDFKYGNHNGLNGTGDISGLTVDGNTLELGGGAGLGLSETSATVAGYLVQNNIFANNGASGAALSLYHQSGGQILKNTAYGNCVVSTDSGIWQYCAGIKWFANGNDGPTLVADNLAHDNGIPEQINQKGIGLWNDSANNVLITRNKSYQNSLVGIFIEKSASTVVAYNLSYNNTYNNPLNAGISGNFTIRAGEGLNSDGIALYNNTSYGGSIGLYFTQGMTSALIKNTLVKNNIFTGSSNYALYADKGADNNVTDGSGNVYAYDSSEEFMGKLRLG